MSLAREEWAKWVKGIGNEIRPTHPHDGFRYPQRWHRRGV